MKRPGKTPVAAEGIIHLHSVYSYDGKFTLEQLRDECIKRSLSFLLMTEHAGDFDSAKMQSFVSACHAVSGNGFLAVPGLEFEIYKEHDIHLLACGLNEMPKDWDFESIAAAVEKCGGFTVIAHPKRCKYYVPPEIVGKIDGIEVWNAAYDSRYLPNDKSYRLLQNLRTTNPELLGFGGLDLHDPSGFRNVNVALLEECQKREELLHCMKQGNYRIRNPFMNLRPDTDMGVISLNLLALARKGLNTADQINLWCQRLKRSRAGTRRLK